MKCLRFLAALSALALHTLVAVGDPSANQHEISGLLDRIEHSSCRFMRNGSGYSGHEAAEHLRAKWQVVEKGVRGGLTAEQFIDQVASVSSLSGRPYEVDCSSAGHGTLSAWLRELLKAIRHGVL